MGTESKQGGWGETFSRNEKDDVAYVRHEYLMNGCDLEAAEARGACVNREVCRLLDV